jgi:hypothetical protein
MRESLNVIIENLNNAAWLEEHGIVAKDKGDYWVLNYNQMDKNPYNVLTRGLVIHKSGRIASCPFFRFFNFGETLAAKVDFTNADIMEKLDGSLVGIFFPEGDIANPVWHFRNLISAHKKDRDFAIKGFDEKESRLLLMAVKPYLKGLNFEGLQDYTLIFEFISEANPVITIYEPYQYGLYLIGARNLTTLQEKSENELDELAFTIGVRRPRRWSASSYEEIVAMMSNFPKDYEGFVVRDRTTGDRNKIKSEDYLKRHHLLTRLNYKNLIPLYFEGERGEIEAYHSRAKDVFDKIEAAYEAFVEKALTVLLDWQNKNVSRKEVALGIVGKEKKYICSVVFRFLELKEGQKAAIQEFVKKMPVVALIEALELKEDFIIECIDEI